MAPWTDSFRMGWLSVIRKEDEKFANKYENIMCKSIQGTETVDKAREI